ncbi:helix-turn-helix domain-containing protein, partial [Pseudomonas viridiflava]
MIRELKTLVAVAQAGTFAAAGNRIGLTQAAVSAQMQRLEAELGFALFERKGRSAQLNRMGHQTLLQAQELIRLYHNLG